jgi:hypothetical protein
MSKTKKALTGAAVAVSLAASVLFGIRGDEAVHDRFGVAGADRSDFGTVVETSNTLNLQPAITPFEKPGFGLPGDIAGELSLARKRLERHRGAGFMLKAKDTDEWSRIFELNEALARFRDKLESSPEGKVFYLRAKVDGYKEKGARFDMNPLAIVRTSGNDAVDLIIGTVVERFPSVRSMGILVCKRISGTSNWSQHAYGNAVDFGGPGSWGSPENIALLDDVVDYVNALAPILPVSQVGWRNWPDHYPGHVHFSGAPLRSGTPACA